MAQATTVEEIINQIPEEEQVQLAFTLLRRIAERRKVELERELDQLKAAEEDINRKIDMVLKKKAEIMPIYEKYNKIMDALDYAEDHLKSQLKDVRDKIKLVEGRFKAYITRLENVLTA